MDRKEQSTTARGHPGSRHIHGPASTQEAGINTINIPQGFSQSGSFARGPTNNRHYFWSDALAVKHPDKNPPIKSEKAPPENVLPIEKHLHVSEIVCAQLCKFEHVFWSSRHHVTMQEVTSRTKTRNPAHAHTSRRPLRRSQRRTRQRSPLRRAAHRTAGPPRHNSSPSPALVQSPRPHGGLGPPLRLVPPAAKRPLAVSISEVR